MSEFWQAWTADKEMKWRSFQRCHQEECKKHEWHEHQSQIKTLQRPMSFQHILNISASSSERSLSFLDCRNSVLDLSCHSELHLLQTFWVIHRELYQFVCHLNQGIFPIPATVQCCHWWYPFFPLHSNLALMFSDSLKSVRPQIDGM